MTTVTIEEAQAHLPEILQGLQPGEEVTITDHGEPLAQVTKAQLLRTRLRTAPGLGKGILPIVSDDDEHLEDFAEYLP